jgi:hypothetical protein
MSVRWAISCAMPLSSRAQHGAQLKQGLPCLLPGDWRGVLAVPTGTNTKKFLRINAQSQVSRPRTLDEIPERVRQIAMMRGLGYSYREITDPFSDTPQAVSLMLMRHRRSLKCLRGAMELTALSPRAVNALGRHGIRTREQARQANVLERLAGERNCGRKTIDEITRWGGAGNHRPGQKVVNDPL